MLLKEERSNIEIIQNTNADTNKAGKTSCKVDLNPRQIHINKVAIPNAIEPITANEECHLQCNPITMEGKKQTAYKLPEKIVISTISPGGFKAKIEENIAVPTTTKRVNLSGFLDERKGITKFL